jgi:hypothetical protein
MRPIIFPAIFFTLVFCVSAQTKEAQKVDEFTTLNCEDIAARTNGLIQILSENPESKAFIIFYEGQHLVQFYNKK